MDALEALAHYTGHAAWTETCEGLAKRCGIVSMHGKGIKNYIHRAVHPNEEHSDTRHYAPVISENLCKLLDGLGLTIAPIDNTVPQTAHVMMLINAMDIRPDAKAMAIHAVQRAGMMKAG